MRLLHVNSSIASLNNIEYMIINYYLLYSILPYNIIKSYNTFLIEIDNISYIRYL